MQNTNEKKIREFERDLLKKNCIVQIELENQIKDIF